MPGNQIFCLRIFPFSKDVSSSEGNPPTKKNREECGIGDIKRLVGRVCSYISKPSMMV